MQHEIFTLHTDGCASDHVRAFGQLEELICSGPEVLIIKMRGGGSLSADAALTYIDMLETLGKGIERMVLGHCNMLAPAFALFLNAAPNRDFRPKAWVYVASQLKERNPLREHEHDLCLKAIEKHIEPAFFHDRLIGIKDLRDFGVVATQINESFRPFIESNGATV